jgi:hypothetical protein
MFKRRKLLFVLQLRKRMMKPEARRIAHRASGDTVSREILRLFVEPFPSPVGVGPAGRGVRGEASNFFAFAHFSMLLHPFRWRWIGGEMGRS